MVAPTAGRAGTAPIDMTRLILALAVCTALTAPALRAQDAPLPELSDIESLTSPTAPGALRGLTLCLAVRSSEHEGAATRTVHYLARLLEGSGARVALVGSPARDEPLEELAADAGAALVLQIAWRDGDVSAVSIPFPDPRRPEAERLQRAFVAQLDEQGLAGLVDNVRSADVPKVPSLEIGLTGATDLRAHREPAHRLFRCVVSWWEAVGDAARELAGSTSRGSRGAASRRAAAPNPLWPLDRPPENNAEVAAFLTNWKRAGLADATQVWLDVRVERVEGEWVLTGSTELPRLEESVRRALSSVGVEVASGGLRVLPDVERLGREPFGIVTATSVQTWSRPGRATGLRAADPDGQFEETDLLRGEPVWLLDREDDSLLVHAASGYLGWVRDAAIERVDEETFRAALAPADATGALVARRGLARLGTPYVFGGRSENGIDCSGFVGACWATEGVFLPRDARQQILAGRLVSTAQRRLPLEPGDLLFFANPAGRISHVGMSLGGWRFVHATPPEVTVGSLESSDPLYTDVAERFVLAKRVAQ